jgi:hypothetical protein
VAVKRSIAWDAAKAEANLARHGISFEEATQVFDDTLAGYFRDDLHSVEEDRYIAVGRAINLRVLIVVYTIREDQNAPDQRSTGNAGRNPPLYEHRRST